jgi:hypothetical protein
MLKRSAILGSAVLLAASQSGGCGNSGGSSGGGGAGVLNCILDLQFTGPVSHRLTAALDVTCDFPATTSRTVLTIQHQPAGGDPMSWTLYDDPKTTTQAPPVSLTYAALCSPGQWEAVATIDGTGPDAQPFHSTATEALPGPLTAADCTS